MFIALIHREKREMQFVQEQFDLPLHPTQSRTFLLVTLSKDTGKNAFISPNKMCG
jgi:hypothetical protein